MDDVFEGPIIIGAQGCFDILDVIEGEYADMEKRVRREQWKRNRRILEAEAILVREGLL